MIVVYFDGQCGLCAKEIRYYQQIAPVQVFEWVDIMAEPKQITQYGVTLQDALMALHVQDHLGQWHKGLQAFQVIWRELPRWRWLAFITALPVLSSCLNVCYRVFAAWRFKRSKHCQLINNKESE